MLPQNPNAFVEYCENVKGYKNVRVLKEKIKKNTLISVNGFPMRIRGETERDLSFKSSMQLTTPFSIEKSIYKIEKFLSKYVMYDVDIQRDELNDDLLNSVYDVFIFKLKTVYKKRPANPNKKEFLEKQERIFKDTLSLKEKCICINQILNILRCDVGTTADLSLIRGTTKTGNISVNKNTASKKCKLRIINQSITGLFVNVEEL